MELIHSLFMEKKMSIQNIEIGFISEKKKMKKREKRRREKGENI